MMSSLKLYRKLVGGIWYKYQMTGQLPGCYGSFWNNELWPSHRYYIVTSVEIYEKKL